jgi:hypothetical protein
MVPYTKRWRINSRQKMEKELNDFIGGRDDDDDDDAAAAPPLIASHRSVLQQVDDDVFNLKCRPWKSVLPFCVDHVHMGDTAVVGSFRACDLFKLVGCLYKGTIA